MDEGKRRDQPKIGSGADDGGPDNNTDPLSDDHPAESQNEAITGDEATHTTPNTEKPEKDASFSPSSESLDQAESPKEKDFDLGAARWLSKGTDASGTKRFRLAIGSGLTRQWIGESITLEGLDRQALDKHNEESNKQKQQRDRVRAHRVNNTSSNP